MAEFNYWHGDISLDILGRTRQQLEREIERQEMILKIREGYKSVNEGYPQRTDAIRRSIEFDREELAKIIERTTGSEI